MKHKNTKEKSSFFPYRLTLAGLCLLLFVGIAWTALHEDEMAHADGGMFSSAYSSLYSDKVRDAGILMGSSEAQAQGPP